MNEPKLSMGRRARELGIEPGILAPGHHNAITDVPGVRVGHVTLIRDDDIRTGATAILPHAGNVYDEKVPAGITAANGFGKLMGFTQVVELGEIETPIVLTNTLSIPRAADAILDWTLSQPGGKSIRSVNPIVGETNDGKLNAIEKRVLSSGQILDAITSASTEPPMEGNVGAGTGTIAFWWKGGIGTSSRVLPQSLGGYCVGVLVQSNFGGVLQILGVPIGQLLKQHYLCAELAEASGYAERGESAKLEELANRGEFANREEFANRGEFAELGEFADDSADGSIMIIVATNAPLSDRNLTRLARRAFAGLARTGSSFVNGSGDYAIAFSTAKEVRRTQERRQGVPATSELANESVSPLFQAAIEATEEAIYNSLFRAETMIGRDNTTIEALPIDLVLQILQKRGAIARYREGNGTTRS